MFQRNEAQLHEETMFQRNETLFLQQVDLVEVKSQKQVKQMLSKREVAVQVDVFNALTNVQVKQTSHDIDMLKDLESKFEQTRRNKKIEVSSREEVF